MSRSPLGFVAIALAWPVAAFAQTPAPPAPAPAPAAAPAATAPAAPATSTPAPAAQPGPTPKKGVLGVGPFWQAIDRGDAAYAARDFDSAVKAYREAIE